MVAAFAVALAAWGLVALAVAFADTGTYGSIARQSGFAETTSFVFPAGGASSGTRAERVDLAFLLQWHQRWADYVLGRAGDAPRGSQATFSGDEIAHMSDVRGLFAAAQAVMYAGALGTIVLFGLALRGGPRTAGLLLRSGALAAGAGVVVLGLVGAVAFEPAFLAFHYVFFPQGNFLFDPATSNLIRLYPEAYWYGVTLRIGGAFVAIAIAVALVGWFLARSARVTPR
jgi:integral membrane protein (TIGR01906 family)